MIKLISTCSFPGELNNYQRFIEIPNELVFLGTTLIIWIAPEECNVDLIQKGQYPSHVDPCLA